MRRAEDAFIPHPHPHPQAGEGASGRGGAGVRLRNARALRANATDAEQLLWRHLRNRQLGGHKFRRQYPSGPYILDFVCLEQHRAVELDGGQHAAPHHVARDRQRTLWLQAQGLQVPRCWNHDVLQQPSGVLQQLLQALTTAHAPGARAGHTKDTTP